MKYEFISVSLHEDCWYDLTLCALTYSHSIVVVKVDISDCVLLPTTYDELGFEILAWAPAKNKK